ncbi:hypothetical protein HYT23_03710 [Candidatus Pacearchaeota archaeon]|nr:hypothetical protein [Candidatus Pacearchaeota archaeon]
MAKKKGNLLGSWAFLIGVILAVVLGIAGIMNATWIYILVVLGLIVGLLNVADAEARPFLLSGIALLLASALGQEVTSRIRVLNSILDALLAIFVPATIIVAIKNVFSLAKN